MIAVRLLLSCFWLASLAAHAASAPQLVPATPAPFEPVALRISIDSCAFEPSSVRVTNTASVIRVTQQLNNCLVPAPLAVVDIRLGSLPSGDYRVELYYTPSTSGPPAVTLPLSVTPRPEAALAVYPPPPRPLTDVTGVWWTSTESGWGLSLTQSSTDVLFGALFVYGAGGQPEWFTLQDGHWAGYAVWTATVYRSTGPYYGGAFDPSRVALVPVGSATLDFSQAPGTEDRATLEYSVDGTTVTETIARMRF